MIINMVSRKLMMGATLSSRYQVREGETNKAIKTRGFFSRIIRIRY